MTTLKHQNTITQVCDTAGIYRDIEEYELIKVAQHCIKERFNAGKALTSAKDSEIYCQVLLAPYEHEVFYAIWLNSQHHVIGHGVQAHGSIDSATIYPREVVKEALRHNASAVIFSHNHPSGLSEPSQADISITKRLRDALSLIDIRVLDHIIVGTDTSSMAQTGLL